ncbi:glycoside hydrolase family 5 protein [Laccaria amethystina LaAM-08-1]|uniref:Glycoside hydrolase family 5 protein n=1 Tax=Laccaria amethystina LaAM-08-1 TaxID=1095629 RepID=A0A0C9WSW8_9AGAR|nr:glycoside hydrolase family 5 protein [Laccaria amethystina LaAM-08-1]
MSFLQKGIDKPRNFQEHMKMRRPDGMQSNTKDLAVTTGSILTISEAFYPYCEATEYRLACCCIKTSGLIVLEGQVGAAWLLGMRGRGHVEAERGIWPCGDQKLSAATMATCFWVGATYAPKLLVKDPPSKEVNIQQYL